MRQAQRVTKTQGEEACRERGFHDDKEYIDPRSGGFVRCQTCGREVDCEDDEEW